MGALQQELLGGGHTHEVGVSVQGPWLAWSASCLVWSRIGAKVKIREWGQPQIIYKSSKGRGNL